MKKSLNWSQLHSIQMEAKRKLKLGRANVMISQESNSHLRTGTQKKLRKMQEVYLVNFEPVIFRYFLGVCIFTSKERSLGLDIPPV